MKEIGEALMMSCGRIEDSSVKNVTNGYDSSQSSPYLLSTFTLITYLFLSFFLDFNIWAILFPFPL